MHWGEPNGKGWKEERYLNTTHDADNKVSCYLSSIEKKEEKHQKTKEKSKSKYVSKRKASMDRRKRDI